MSKISVYPARTPVSGDLLVVAVGGHNYNTTYDNLVPKGHIHGLTLSNNAGDATNDIDIAIGEAKDTANSKVMKLTSALTKRLDATWVTGNNQGMRSSSLAISNTTWHIFLMKVGGVDDIGADTSVTGANLVTDHAATNLRRIGSILRISGAIKGFKQVGDVFTWTPGQATDLNGGSDTAYTDIPMTVPSGIKVQVMCFGEAYNATTGVTLNVKDPDIPGDINSNAVFGPSAGHYGSDSFMRFTSAAGNLSYKLSVAASLAYIYTTAYIDTRGRLY